MSDTNYIKIFSGSFIVAQLITEKLDAIGINAVVKDETESGRLAGFGVPIPGEQDLYVNKDELDAAMEIVKTVTSQLKT